MRGCVGDVCLCEVGRCVRVDIWVDSWVCVGACVCVFKYICVRTYVRV